MSVWIRNLEQYFEDRLVIILHGNVRDKYIDHQGRIYTNLTELLERMAGNLPLGVSELVFYDPDEVVRRVILSGAPTEPEPAPAEDPELGGTAPTVNARTGRLDPLKALHEWNKQLASADRNRLVVFFYFDKLVTYSASYSDNDKKAILRLEKLIENISPNNRLVLVALQDTMIPVELYTSSPKTYVMPIPGPGREDRYAYLQHYLDTNKFPNDLVDLISNLTDGLFLRDLDNIIDDLKEEQGILSATVIQRLVNKYRIGEKVDRWGSLKIQRLDAAQHWFVKTEGIKGQDEAIGKVVDMLCLARAGLSGVSSGTRSKPKGTLFFSGPTGVGKTFVAKKLAKFLFDTEEAFVRFDMSEFKEEHTVSKLIGSPPGYVGYERGGQLTNAVRERPFSVVLFDEIEKAHPKILDIFLQILDEGRLTDSRGQTIFLTETVVIFTSNLGTRTNDSRGMPNKERAELEVIIGDEALENEEKRQKIREHFVRCVERFFMSEISRPELLNRIGSNIVPFNFIHAPEVQQDIVRSHLKRIAANIMDIQRSAGHTVEFADEVAPWMVERYGERISMFGGRAIADIIEGEALRPLSRRLLRSEEKGEREITYRVAVKSDGDGLEVQ